MKLNLIYITAADKKEALSLGKKIVEEKLAACVNVIDKMESIYFWEGKLRHGKEAVLIVKARESNNEKIIRRVKELHSYSCPAILVLPITDGNKDYLKWLS
jgi:periplasmic divalent cation tolerance protein